MLLAWMLVLAAPAVEARPLEVVDRRPWPLSLRGGNAAFVQRGGGAATCGADGTLYLPLEASAGPAQDVTVAVLGPDGPPQRFPLRPPVASGPTHVLLVGFAPGPAGAFDAALLVQDATGAAHQWLTHPAGTWQPLRSWAGIDAVARITDRHLLVAGRSGRLRGEPVPDVGPGRLALIDRRTGAAREIVPQLVAGSPWASNGPVRATADGRGRAVLARDRDPVVLVVDAEAASARSLHLDAPGVPGGIVDVLLVGDHVATVLETRDGGIASRHVAVHRLADGALDAVYGPTAYRVLCYGRDAAGDRLTLLGPEEGRFLILTARPR